MKCPDCGFAMVYSSTLGEFYCSSCIKTSCQQYWYAYDTSSKIQLIPTPFTVPRPSAESRRIRELEERLAELEARYRKVTEIKKEKVKQNKPLRRRLEF